MLGARSTREQALRFHDSHHPPVFAICHPWFCTMSRKRLLAGGGRDPPQLIQLNIDVQMNDDSGRDPTGASGDGVE